MMRDSGGGWLGRLRAREALLEGHFRLSSGLHSPHYVQCARLLQHPEDAEAAAQALAARLAPLLPEPPAVVLSPALGGIVLGHELARVWGCRAIFAERAGQPSSQPAALTLRRGFALAAGEPFVAVEDVVTTAGSLRELLAVAIATGARPIGAAALVDRAGGALAWELPFAALVTLSGVQCEPAICPQCAAGVLLERPGSRVDVTDREGTKQGR
ncbi:MAG: orotate phosphoribosyltransferase [Gemmatimonadota bacterium]|nr:orotate phosphoribosyltransferase [Novosphingobium sp.]